MDRKRKLPFRLKDSDIVIWDLSNGGEMELTWKEFDELVHTKGYKEYITLPKKEFEEYYKRMKMPASAREYHANAKRKLGGR